MVILDKKDYIQKTHELLVQPAYRTTERDPTNKLKAKLITMLRKKGTQDWRKNSTRICTPQVVALQILWPAQNPQNRHPLRPIVLSRGSVTYGVAKVLAKILRPLVGKSSPSYTKY